MSFKLSFNNRFVSQLPADVELKNFPRQVHSACYSLVTPSKGASPKLVCLSPQMLDQIGLNLTQGLSEQFLQAFVGNQLLDGMQPYAMCYGGHQFGHWAGQLGDGRAINLGEVKDCLGQYQTLQLKGAGLTPYSRTADGLAVLRSSVREFLCSEAMFHLGVPTTRALSLILTGDKVMRDMFYDGNPEFEPGAVVCRIAPSFIRFGNFQILSARKDTALLKKLMDFCILNDFPHLGAPDKQVYQQWFDEICRSTAELMVHWMRVGFVHGVMNTDNMSILGLTIDFGPYGWLEGYDPEWTPNTTDAQGKRYSYANQPQIAQWNLYQLANAIVQVIGETEGLEKSLQDYADIYTLSSQQMYANKLGLAKHLGELDQGLIESLLNTLQVTETDMTLFFRLLSNIQKNQDYSDEQLLAIVHQAFYRPTEVVAEVRDKILQWLRQYALRITQQEMADSARAEIMNSTNPKFVLRNYLAQQAIDKATQGDFSEVQKLLKIMQKPYEEQHEFEAYAAKRPEWARQKAGCSMLSCSS